MLGLLAALSVASLLAPLLGGCGGGSDCFEDVSPARYETVTQSPYSIRYLSSDLGISAVRWVNATTGASGSGSVQRVEECMLFLGCNTWSEIVADVPLTAGANTLHLYTTSGECESRGDYVITLS